MAQYRRLAGPKARKTVPVARRWVVPAVIAGVVLLAWSGGLVWYSASLPEPPAADAPLRQTDAVVVLTGGAGRVDTGFALLRDGYARALFVSGVYRGVEVGALLRQVRLAPSLLDCCVTLDYVAADTRGNARETAKWMAERQFQSLRVVTATYHMPRAVLELRRAMPGAEIIEHPVAPPGFAPGRLASARGWVLLVGEYIKYLASWLPFLPYDWPAFLRAEGDDA